MPNNPKHARHYQGLTLTKTIIVKNFSEEHYPSNKLVILGDFRDKKEPCHS